MLFDFTDGREPILSGDVHFIFKHKGVINDSQICRIAFNTAFIPHSNSLIFKKMTISPDNLKKDVRFDNDLLIQFVFEDFCTLCNKPWSMKVDQFCEVCRNVIKNDIMNWRAIRMVIDSRAPEISQSEGNLMHFDTEEEGEESKKTLLSLKLQFDSENYKI